jgi:uncharacterized membrane protein YozB (DUF420 family)
MIRLRALLIVAGIAGMAYAASGLITEPGALLFLGAVLVVHDALWMPLVLAAGVLVTRFVPGRHRRTVRVALLIAAAVVAVGAPLALTPGRPADNPSVLPLPYGRNLAIVLAGIVAIAGLTIVARGRRRIAGLTIAARGRKKSERRRPGRSDRADG